MFVWIIIGKASKIQPSLAFFSFLTNSFWKMIQTKTNIFGKKAWMEINRKSVVVSCTVQQLNFKCGHLLEPHQFRRYSTTERLDPVPSTESEDLIQRKLSLKEIKQKANRILSNYPLLLCDNQKSRPSLYDPIPEWWPFHEKVLRPMKKFILLFIFFNFQ